MSRTPSSTSTSRVLARIAALDVVGLGSLVLLGWAFGIEALKSVLPAFVAMKANTALAFIASGVGLWLLNDESGHPLARRMVQACAWSVVAIGGLTLCEYLFGWNPGIDQWLFHELPGAIGTSHPGRMVPNTALAFLFVGIGLASAVGAPWRHRETIVRCCAGSVVILGSAAIFSYFLGVPAGYGGGIHFTLMAVHTAVGFIVLGLGLWMSPQDLSSRAHEDGAHTGRWRLPMLPLAALSLSFAVTLAMTQYVRYQLFQARQITFTHQIDQILEQQSHRMQLAADQLRGFSALFRASKSVERGEFLAYFTQSHIRENSPGLAAVTYVERVSAAERTAFVERVRADRSVQPEGYPAFVITPAPGAFPESYVITYMEPFAANQPAFGFDLGSEPRRRAALTVACDTGEPTLTEPIPFALPEHPKGVLLILPVYRNGTVHDTPEQRQVALAGFVVGAFRVDDLFASMFADTVDALIDVEVFDGNLLTEDHLLFDRDEVLRIYNPTTNAQLHVIKSLPVFGRLWTLSFVTLPGFDKSAVQTWFPIGIFGTGLVLSFLCFGVLSSLLNSRQRALKLAQEMTQDLRASEQSYRDVVDSAPDPVIVLDMLGRVQFLNPAAERVSGYRHDELRGKHFVSTGLVSAGSLPRAIQELSLTIAGGHRPPFEMEILHKGGGKVVLEAHPMLMRSGSKMVGVQVMFRDVTERKTLERDLQRRADELKQTNEELSRREQVMRSLLGDLQESKSQLESQEQSLRTANKRLEEMAALKDEFVAKVSHELRTPLTSIKEGLNLLMDRALGAITGDQEDFLKTMDGDIDRLAELINNMLDLSKIEAGRMRLQRGALDVPDLVRSVLRSFQPMCGQRRMVVECDGTPPIFADHDRMVQVLNNLVSNAIKFTAEDGGVITVRAHRQDGGCVILSVEDNGPGIASEDVPKLFKKFSQVSTPAAGRPRGTGLGLAVCKELVELHKGRIEAASTVGNGTTFSVTMPVYTDSLALAEHFGDVVDAASVEEGKVPAVVALDAAVTDRAAFERFIADVRHHVHRGDIVMPLQSHWAVVLTATTPDGPAAMVRRLQTVLGRYTLRHVGAAVAGVHGVEARVLLEHAMQHIADATAPAG